MGDFAVKIENVSKYYKLYKSPKDRLKEALHPRGKSYHSKFFALSGITLSVKKGEIVGIIGSNGSGKSTLLKLISKVLTPNNGTIEVNGSISALLELGAGFNPNFTGIENLYFYATILGLPKAVIDEKIEDIIAFADIGEYINQPLKTYSNGMKARLGFAIATEIDPDILIVDEVLAVGDAAFQRKCYARLENFLNKGKTVFLVSHNRNSIISLCDRAILLDHGKVQADGKAEEVLALYDILINKKFYTNESSKGLSPTIGGPEGEKNTLSTSTCHYDNTLTSEPVFFQSSHVDLEDFCILNSENEIVNILSTGNTYSIHAKLSFHEHLENLTFALRIKTNQGVRVAWTGFPFQYRKYLKAKKGENIIIRLSFDCNLLAGIYTIDAGLHSSIDDDMTTHVGYQNIYLFRVNKLKSNNNGISFLNFKNEYVRSKWHTKDI